MVNAEWRRIRYFSEGDKWGDPDLMLFDFVHLLDVYRAFHGCPMYVSCGTQGKHATGSTHYIGGAGDFIFLNLALPQLFERFLDALRFDFTEVGIYPHWEYNGVKTGGIHLAKSPSAQGNEPARKKLWLRVPSDEPGVDTQLPVTVENLRHWGFLG